MLAFDTHAHLLDKRYDEDRDDLIASMALRGVRGHIEIGFDMDSSARAVALAREHADIYASVGVHPHEASSLGDGDLETLEKWTALDQVVAIGEIGLDYYYDHSPRDAQRAAFAAQLGLAARLELPAILHVRDAHGDALDMLRQGRGILPRGVLHCFSGSLELACQYMRFGLHISLGGIVTFKNAKAVQDVAREMPIDRLLLETDSPYQTPVPLRGRRNEPANVRLVAKHIASVRGMDTDALIAIANQNAARLFGIQID